MKTSNSVNLSIRLHEEASEFEYEAETLRLLSDLRNSGTDFDIVPAETNLLVGAKDGGQLMLAGQIALLIPSSAALVALINAVKDWVLRRRDSSVVVNFSNRQFELHGEPSAVQIRLTKELIEAFSAHEAKTQTCKDD